VIQYIASTVTFDYKDELELMLRASRKYLIDCRLDCPGTGMRRGGAR